MRLFILTTLLLLSMACQKTEVSVNQAKNSNQANSSAMVNTNTETVRKEENKLIATEHWANNKALEQNPSDGIEKRCGWIENPTPANFWFTDADFEWTIGVQGGYQAEGMDNLPNFGNEWVKTNGNYGYGCICMDVKVDKKEYKVTEIKKASVRPLSVCRSDKNLKEPKAD